ncbi:MAG: alpha/beta fold hydrolase [Gammaproteobacteria bacterium]|nr:alpha/beta fold hydrolase [Gammaproteobacteria bacterium]MBV9619869.1 alpha/beta fold hydrolase [Gammaproteobacteria bacterium]
MAREAARSVRDTPARVRRGYFECRYGQLHVHHAMPPGGGFEEGTPLLCVHDCPGSARSLAPLLGLVGRDRSAYAADLPGYGETDPAGGNPGAPEYAAALQDFIDTMRLRKLDVLAVRAGAAVGVELALTRAAQVQRLVLLSAPLPARDGTDTTGTVGALARYPLRERLARVTQRVLVLRPQDELTEATGRVREVCAAARMTDLEQPGNELLAAAPERLFEAVREFLRG